ncbi:ABC transporter permease [Rhodococcus jostii]|uniref:Peptide/nickel transport system permease protein n=1 Tax=Rhodococcus jostii TaxID=132919 RepID=A0A1H4JDN4_RHOJO|nr:ABC transporter permease [Rhodococcus jostii]SEB44469.1 peptide/nickel transport system permease protein [Rhodococcus jostii]
MSLLSRTRIPTVGAQWGLWLSTSYLALAAIAVVAPTLLAPSDPLETALAAAHQQPGWQHLFGTDRLGRDVLVRVVHGAQYSLFIGGVATAVAVAVGIVLGSAAGTGNRIIDEVVTRVFDLLGSFPEILFALVLIAFTGPGTWNLILAIGLSAAPRYGRVVRAEILAVRESEFVAQARLNTTSKFALTVKHIVPNALVTLPVLATLGLGTSILGTATLSFLGFGTQPPLPEWGSMLSESRDDLRLAWWTVFFPGLAITATVIATTVVGRHLQHRFERRSIQ